MFYEVKAFVQILSWPNSAARVLFQITDFANDVGKIYLKFLRLRVVGAEPFTLKE